MADIKITDLTAYTDPVSTDVLPIVDVSNDLTKKVSIADLLENAGTGSATAPSFSFDGDNNTGVYRPGANQLALTTGGGERLRITNVGNVGINTSSPSRSLEIKTGTGIAGFKQSSSPLATTLEFLRNGVGTISNNAIEVSNSSGIAASINYSGGAYFGANVGIGTSSPDAKLVILEPVGSSTPAKMKFVNAGDRGVTIGFKDHNASPDFAVSSGDEANDWVVIDATGNVGIGTDNPQAKLDVNGDASINTLTVGLGGGSISANTAIGKDVLSSNTTGSHNAALGINALFSNTIGVSNTAIGTGALQGNTEGNNNTAVGRQALYTNTTGINNTALGRNALFSNTIGVYNTAIGVNALTANTDGANNTAIGQSALQGNITGRNNIALGRNALFSNTIGLGNIGIGGVNSLGSYTPVFNPTTQSNRIVMGSTSVTNAYVQVAWTVTSDARDKTNFAPVPYGLDFVNQLKPTAYQFKLDRDAEETNGGVRYGFKAQDILALEGENPVIIDIEDPDHLKYKGEHLVPVLVNAVQELTTIVKELQAEVVALKGT